MPAIGSTQQAGQADTTRARTGFSSSEQFGKRIVITISGLVDDKRGKIDLFWRPRPFATSVLAGSAGGFPWTSPLCPFVSRIGVASAGRHGRRDAVPGHRIGAVVSGKERLFGLSVGLEPIFGLQSPMPDRVCAAASRSS